MDNLLEFIILAVFILSGINSLFGNKKKGRGKVENQRSVGNNKNVKKKIPQDELDILEDFFGVKKEKTYSHDPFEDPNTVNKTGYNNSNYDSQGSWNPEDEFNTKQEIKQTDVEARQKIFNEISNIDYDKVIPSKTYLEQIKYDDTSKPSLNRRVIEVKRILKSRNNVKDAVIIAEILNKPKAYRRGGNGLLR